MNALQNPPQKVSPRCPRCGSLHLVTRHAAANGRPVTWFECVRCEWSQATVEGVQTEFDFVAAFEAELANPNTQLPF
jgi:hypothetical protein